MTSSKKKIAANRRNAQKSTGPKTAKGKANVSKNAIRHGMQTLSPVLRGVESVEDWEAHRQGILEALAPEGPLETYLADRIAFQAWRLYRVGRYEQTTAAAALETVEDDYARENAYVPRDHYEPTHPQDIRESLKWARVEHQALEDFTKAPKNRHIDGADASSIVCAVARAADVDADELTHEGLPADMEDWQDLDTWTAGLVRQVLDTITAAAKDAERSRDELLEVALDTARLEVARAESRTRDMEPELRRRTLDRVLPHPGILATIARHESHIERSLFRTMHELRRLQESRQAAQGGPVERPTAAVGSA